MIFGHHFASIAGTGPIVGPAIAVIWGWVPAILWVFFGSIFIGAVHDFGVLIASMRNRGRSIADITGIYISWRTKFFFFIIGIFELWIFIAILGLVMAIIFDLYPGSVLLVIGIVVSSPAVRCQVFMQSFRRTPLPNRSTMKRMPCLWAMAASGGATSNSAAVTFPTATGSGGI